MQANSRIVISFDSWKADNKILDLLSVLAHYIDKQYKLKTFVLALRDTYGSHSSDNIKDHLLTVLREYQISNKVAYFAADNATNNNKALRLLADELSIDPVNQRLRCLSHIINLVSTAILYSVDEDYVDEVLTTLEAGSNTSSQAIAAFNATIATKDEATRLQAWRKKGPIGKLHLLVVHIKHSNQRRVFFESKQREAGGKASKLYRVVLNGGI